MCVCVCLILVLKCEADPTKKPDDKPHTHKTYQKIEEQSRTRKAKYTVGLNTQTRSTGRIQKYPKETLNFETEKIFI